MSQDDLENLLNSVSRPTPEEKAFFVKRRALGLGVGLDEHGKIVYPKKLIFIDFKASSLSSDSWPIEIGLAWIEGRDVAFESKLIQPNPDWSLDDWSEESAAVHNIPFNELSTAEPAADVAHWLKETVGDDVLVSDAPEFDQRWLDRLIATIGEPARQIDGFDRLVWISFSREDGIVAPGEIDKVYKTRAERPTTHRAGADAADMAHAYKAGLPRPSSPDFFEPMSEEDLRQWEGGEEDKD